MSQIKRTPLIERQVVADRVVQFYVENGKPETVRHFTAQGEKIRTILDIIQRYERTGSSELKKVRAESHLLSLQRRSKRSKD